MDYTSLLLSVNELKSSDHFSPSLCENVQQMDEFNIALGLKGLSSRQPNWLQVCWHPVRARVGAGHPPPRTEPKLFSFSSTLRSLLKGLALTRIDMGSGTERIVELYFSERINEEPIYKLVTEIVGSRSNVILVETATNTIMAVAYQVSSTSSMRPLQTGGLYQPPPEGSGVYDPTAILAEPGAVHRHIKELWESAKKKEQERELKEVEVEDIVKPLQIKAKKKKRGGRVVTTTSPLPALLVGLYRGMSPNIARAAIQDFDGEMTLQRVVDDEDALRKVEVALCRWATTIGELLDGSTRSDFQRGPVLTAEGSFCPAIFKEEGSLSTSLDFFRDYYESHRLQEEFHRVASDCRKRLHARSDKVFRLMSTFTEAIEQASETNAEKAQSLGDLVTAYLYNWQHAPTGVIGRNEVLECFDFVTGEPVRVIIPESTSPADHASSLYRKAKKLRRSREVSEALLKKVQLHAEYLQELTAALEGVESGDIGDYRRLAAELPVLLEIQEEVLELEESPLVEESSALYRDGAGAAAFEEEVEEDWAAPPPGGKLKGKEKYLAHRQRVQDKKNRQVKASEDRKKGLKKDKGKPKGKGGGEQGQGQGPGQKKGKALAGLTVLHPQSPDLAGTSLVVGRSSKQNDRISFQVAKDHHVWFHADGVPGSHCLLLLQPGEEASDAALQFGADVAAWHSKARGNSDAPVTFTSPRHLKKITGGGPGMVSVMKATGMLRGRPEAGQRHMEEHLVDSPSSD